MTGAEYRRTPGREFEGRRARVTRDIGNRVGSIKAGSVVTIERKFKGFEVVSEDCEHCGVRLRITRVDPMFIELLPQM